MYHLEVYNHLKGDNCIIQYLNLNFCY